MKTISDTELEPFLQELGTPARIPWEGIVFMMENFQDQIKARALLDPRFSCGIKRETGLFQ